MIQSCFFTVGAFFFFTAGVMAYAVYVPKFTQKYRDVTKKLILKGLKIYAIYIFYLVTMKVAKGIKFEGGIIDFLFMHDLFLKVLFTFGTLYICAPFFIFLVGKTKNNAYVLLFITVFIYLVLKTVLKENGELRMVFVDRHEFLYPLLPSFMMFFLGMVFCIIEKNKKTYKFISDSSKKYALYLIGSLLIFLCILNKLFLNINFIENTLFVTFRESIVITIAVLCIRRLLKYNIFIRAGVENWKGLGFGVKSLTAYVAGNILIGLISAHLNLLSVKFIILGTVLWITYLVSYWNWKSDSASKYLGKRAK